MKNLLLIRDVSSIAIYLTTFFFILSINNVYALVFALLHLVRNIAIGSYNYKCMKYEQQSLEEFEYLMSLKKEKSNES